MKHAVYSALLLVACILVASCTKSENHDYPSLSVDMASINVENGQEISVTILSGSGSYSVSVTDKSIAEATLESETIHINALAVGTTDLTINDDLSEQSVNIPINVNPVPVIKFHTAYRFGDLSLVIDAPEDSRDRVWIDLNNNGIKDEGEAVTEFGVKAKYAFNENISIYGPVSVFEAYMMAIDEIDITTSVYLRKLNLQINNVEEIDLSNNTLLEDINLSNNSYLSSLNLNSLSVLKKLSCSGTSITTLDLSHCPELEDVACIASMTKCIILGDITKITKLNIWNNELQELDLSHLADLNFLNISNCNFSSIDLTSNPKLEMLSCGGNKLTSLDLTKNSALIELYIGRNPFESDVISGIPAPEKVEKLQVYANMLTSAEFSKFENIKEIHVYSNNINADKMTALVSSLPERTAEDMAKIYIMDSSPIAEVQEGNIVEDPHIETCTQKKWQAFDYNSGAGAIALNII